MTQQIAPVEMSSFTGGLVTDANPMSFPPNASLNEQNMLIKQDGSRSRRLGMDVETNCGYINTGTKTTVGADISYKSFRWDNVAGVPDLSFIAVHIGSYLAIFDGGNESLSSVAPLLEIGLGEGVNQVGFAAVDGILVVASGLKDLTYIEYKPTTRTFNTSTYRLLIRDLFGVEDIIDGINYRQGSYISKRPRKMTDNHAYNLRNQTFGFPRLPGFELLGNNLRDPIDLFNYYSNTTYPANGDSVLDALYPNTAHHIDPMSNRFNPLDIISNPSGSMPAPRGFFIIDALDRGTSRMTEITKLHQEKAALLDKWKPQRLPQDETPSGATCLAQFAGRMFYAGFTSEIVDGDECSPRMGSYVLFSKLVESVADLSVCHQVGDPTSKEHYELLDTDGGFIRLDGAYNIQGLVPLPTGLAVIAQNGVWLITGEDRGQFKATSYSTSKISPEGCESPGSIVSTGNGFMFWSKDGIYEAAPNQFGDLVVTNLTRGRMLDFYNKISLIDRRYVVGLLDHYDRCIKWTYGSRLNSDTVCYELVYNLDFKAFSPMKINRGIKDKGGEVTYPDCVVVCPVLVPSYYTLSESLVVYVGTSEVDVGTDVVTATGFIATASVRETKYLVVTNYADDFVEFTFSSYTNTNHYDWSTLQSDDGIDADAYLLTGWINGTDNQRNKQVPFLTVHFYKTEDGFTEIVSEDDIPEYSINNPSSCKIQAQWSWSNHINSGKWGSEFQAYRLGRQWIPPNVTSGYDNGFYLVNTRNKLRGMGKVLSLLFKSEPGYHMHIIGWSMLVGINQGV